MRSCDGDDPVFGVVAVDCVDDVLSSIVVVELICVVVPMIRWRVGWLSKRRATTEVFHGGAVSEAVRELMYQDLDALELDDCVMFLFRN